MLDFENLEKYKENNRIEAKKSLGGLPKSIWETYSAFANTLGGYILLGVIETDDKTFDTVDLPDPDRLIREFWEIVNNPKKVSVNLLSTKDVFVEEVNGCHIVVIYVPRAERSYRPVYLEDNPKNCYRRNGEGDYKCDSETMEAMIRDASVKTQDMKLLTKMDLSVFNVDTIREFRKRMKDYRPGYFLEQLEDEEFLEELGAIGIGEDKKKHPTAAGLLMFGNGKDIIREFRNYSLAYKEEDLEINWNGNIHDFYFYVCDRIQQDTVVHQAICEALTNCLVNADYYGLGGIVITKKKDSIELSNPGSFRIESNVAIGGGVSDPRNSTLSKMFNLIDIGERIGSGIPNIFNVWKKRGWKEPFFIENYDPDRVELYLSFEKEKISDKKLSANHGIKERIVSYLTENPEGKIIQIAEFVGIKESLTRDYLKELVKEEIVEAIEENEDSIYRLKIK